MVTKYQKRISGLLLDRIDIHVEVQRVEYEKLSDSRFGESSEMVRTRAEAAAPVPNTSGSSTPPIARQLPVGDFNLADRLNYA
jgi:hypothetical protein